MKNIFKKNAEWKFILNDALKTFHEFDLNILLTLTILITSSLLIYFLVHFVITEKENVIDYNTFLLLRQTINPTEIKLAKVLSTLGTGNFLLPAYAFIVICLKRKNNRYLAYFISFTASGSLLLGWILKWVFHRNRPLEHLVAGAGGYSFPSGHALGGFIFSGIILYLVWLTSRKIFAKWLLSVFTVLLGFGIGISRIYLHVHYATDVLGSLFIAIWWLSFSYLVSRFISREKVFRDKESFGTTSISNNYYINN
jgi:undecaprenyl-diphosphatase